MTTVEVKIRKPRSIAKAEARRILEEHVAGYLAGEVAEYENADDLFADTVTECSWALVNKWQKEKWPSMYYNEVRNELTILLDKLFFA